MSNKKKPNKTEICNYIIKVSQTNLYFKIMGESDRIHLTHKTEHAFVNVIYKMTLVANILTSGTFPHSTGGRGAHYQENQLLREFH